jgi:Spy/CpxP family protein refolding chaperone
MKTRSDLLTIVLVALLVFASTLFAQPFGQPKGDCDFQPMGKHFGKGNGRGMGKANIWFEIGLSDSQINNIQKMKFDHKKEMLPLKREEFELHVEKKSLMEDPVKNEKRLKAIIARQNEIKTVTDQNRLENHNEVLSHLTDDQKAELEKLKETRSERRGGRKGCRGKKI